MGSMKPTGLGIGAALGIGTAAAAAGQLGGR